jgi:tetratricopeptide (TPR) repeat protein
VGEAGAGKSRLVAELTRELPGWRVLYGRPASLGRATAYALVVQLLRGWAGLDDRDDAAAVRRTVEARGGALGAARQPALAAAVNLLAPSAGDPQWDALDPAQRRERIAEALKLLLLRESAAQPLLVVVEDLHWLDPESQECLDALVEGLGAARLMLLVDYRPEYRHAWAHRPGYTQVRVDPLPADSAGELIDALLGTHQALAPLKQALIDRTDGNPFFLEESVRALAESGALAGDPGAYRLARPLSELAVPATVQAVLAARIDRLGPDDKALLQTAAVLGKTFVLSHLRAVSAAPEPALRHALRRLQAGEFIHEARLFPDIEYTFKHALTHAVAYEGLLAERRRELHAAALAALERLHAGRLEEAAETLAHHAVRAEAWAPAVDHLRAAAARAYERGAIGDTMQGLEEALALTARLPATPDNAARTIDVRLDLHAPVLMQGQTARLLALHDETHTLARAAGDRLRLGRTLYRMSSARWLTAQYADGGALAREALALAGDDAEIRIFATLYIGIHSFFTGRFDEAIASFLRIVEGPDAVPARRRFGSAGPAYFVAGYFLVWALATVGQFDRALEHGRRTVDVVDEPGTPYQAPVYNFLALALSTRGEHAEAVHHAETAVHLAESQKMLSWLPATWSTLGTALVAAGRAEAGLPFLERAVATHEGLGIRCFLSLFVNRWAEGLHAVGRLDEAETMVRRAADLAARAGERAVEAEALVMQGAIAETRAPGHPSRAGDLYSAAIATADDLGMRPLAAQARLRRAALWRQHGEPARAAGDVAVAAEMFDAMAMRGWRARADALATSSRP